jgi:hypothetical protein
VSDHERDVLALWQDQAAEGFRMTPEEIQMNVQRLESRMHQRTRGGYLVAGFLIVAFAAWAVVDANPILRAGAAAVIIAVAYLGYQVHQNRFRQAPASAVAISSIDHLRAELERQRDFHRGRTFWSRMLLLGPAGLLFFYGFATAHPEVIRIIRIEIASFILFALAAIPLNLWLARKYQRQIDELDQQRKQP